MGSPAAAPRGGISLPQAGSFPGVLPRLCLLQPSACGGGRWRRPCRGSPSGSRRGSRCRPEAGRLSNAAILEQRHQSQSDRGDGRHPPRSVVVAMSYAELQVTTNFGFLRGASHPGELVLTAKALGMAAIGVDRLQQSGRGGPGLGQGARDRPAGADRLPAGLRRRHARRALLSHRPGGVGAADPSSHGRPAADEEGRVPSDPVATFSTTARAKLLLVTPPSNTDESFQTALGAVGQ